jgi:hypothetical protein
MKTRHSRCIGKHGKNIFWAALFAAGCFPSSYAADFSYGLGYAGTYSSNITRVPVNERSEWINSAFGGFAYAENTPSVIARVITEAEYRNYSKNVYSDETLFDAKANAVWILSPQQFTWSVDDTYTQLLVDTTAADTPSNRTNTNTFSTGPDFTARFSPVNSLALGARAGNFYTSRHDIDNNRQSGTASWQYQSTAIATYSLNYGVLKVNYDNDTFNTDFSRQDIYIRARVRPSRSEFTLDLGKTDINPVRGKDSNGSLARLTWLRQMTPESSVSVSLSKEVTDVGSDVLASSGTATSVAGSSVGSPVTAAPPSLAQNVVTSDVYIAKRGEIGYSHRGSQFGTTLYLFTREFDYELTPVDRREKGGHVEFSYAYFGTSTVSLFGDFVKTEYLNFVREDTDKDSGLRFAYLAGRNVTFGAEARHIIRSSTISTLDFVENRALLTVAYASGPFYKPTLGR